MAGVNELQVGRFNAILHKVFSMKEGAPAPTLAPELLSTICLEHDRPEWKFLGGEHLASARGTQAAGAAQLASVGLRNPGASGALVILEQIVIENPDGGSREFDIIIHRDEEISTFPTTQVRAWRDVRGMNDVNASASAGGGLVGIIAGGLAVVLPTVNAVIHRIRCNSDSRILEMPFVLEPASGVLVRGIVVNEACAASFTWRERALEPSETR